MWLNKFIDSDVSVRASGAETKQKAIYRGEGVFGGLL